MPRAPAPQMPEFLTTAATLEGVYLAHSPEHQGRAVGIM